MSNYISTLPTELISEIFIIVICRSHNCVCFTEPLRLSGVCKTWQAVAFDTPQLWTNLSFTVSDSITVDDIEFYTVWLNRARSRHLNLVVITYKLIPPPYFFDFFHNLRNRIASLTFDSTILMSIFYDILPHLSTVRFEMNNPGEFVTAKQMLAVLSSSPNLTSLDIDMVADYDRQRPILDLPWTYRGITNISLTSERTDMSRLLAYITVPTLKELNITLGHNQIARLADFLQRSSSSLENLCIGAESDDEYWVETDIKLLLQVVPVLATLKLYGNDTLIASTISVLTNIRIIPHVQYLEIELFAVVPDDNWFLNLYNAISTRSDFLKSLRLDSNSEEQSQWSDAIESAFSKLESEGMKIIYNL